MDRLKIADQIVEKRESQRKKISPTYANTRATIGYLYEHDRFSKNLAQKVFECCHSGNRMKLKKVFEKKNILQRESIFRNLLLKKNLYASA